MLMHLVVIFFLILILYCLGSGVFFLVKAGVDPKKLAKALTWRIALSIALFLFLILAFSMGWMTPNDVMVSPPGT